MTATIHSHLYLDGAQIAENVTQHQQQSGARGFAPAPAPR
jgi:hypothetical protein